MSATYAPAPSSASIPGIRARIGAISEWFLRPSVLIRIVLYLTAAIYLRTLLFDYVYDDNSLIVVNPWIESWKYVPTVFTHSFWSFADALRGVDYYRPLVMLTFFSIRQVFGPAPGWFHLVAAAIHVLATYLVYRLACETVGNRTTAAIAAGIFGLHPTKVETAAWISGISDSLCVVFFLASIIGYFQSKKETTHPVKTLGFSLLMLLLAFFSKEAAIFAPVLISIYEFSTAKTGFLNRCRCVCLAVWPYWAVTMIAVTIRLFIVRVPTGHLVNEIPVSPTVFAAPKALLWYIGKQLWPAGLSIQYPDLSVAKFSFSQFVLPLCLVLGFLLALTWAVHKSAIGIFYLTWFLLMLAPVLLYQMQLQEHDRYFYLASVATSIGAAHVLTSLSRFGATPQAVVVVAIFAVLGAVTLSYESYWDNDLKLFTRAFALAPYNSNAARYLAQTYIGSKQEDKAEAIGRQLIQTDHGKSTGWYILAMVNLCNKDYEQARTDMENSLNSTDKKLLPTVAIADIDLLLNREDEAIRLYEQELREYPEMVALRHKLAQAQHQARRSVK